MPVKSISLAAHIYAGSRNKTAQAYPGACTSAPQPPPEDSCSNTSALIVSAGLPCLRAEASGSICDGVPPSVGSDACTSRALSSFSALGQTIPLSAYSIAAFSTSSGHGGLPCRQVPHPGSQQQQQQVPTSPPRREPARSSQPLPPQQHQQHPQQQMSQPLPPKASAPCGSDCTGGGSDPGGSSEGKEVTSPPPPPPPPTLLVLSSGAQAGPADAATPPAAAERADVAVAAAAAAATAAATAATAVTGTGTNCAKGVHAATVAGRWDIRPDAGDDDTTLDNVAAAVEAAVAAAVAAAGAAAGSDMGGWAGSSASAAWLDSQDSLLPPPMPRQGSDGARAMFTWPLLGASAEGPAAAAVTAAGAGSLGGRGGEGPQLSSVGWEIRSRRDGSGGSPAGAGAPQTRSRSGGRRSTGPAAAAGRASAASSALELRSAAAPLGVAAAPLGVGGAPRRDQAAVVATVDGTAAAFGYRLGRGGSGGGGGGRAPCRPQRRLCDRGYVSPGPASAAAGDAAGISALAALGTVAGGGGGGSAAAGPGPASAGPSAPAAAGDWCAERVAARDMWRGAVHWHGRQARDVAARIHAADAGYGALYGAGRHGDCNAVAAAAAAAAAGVKDDGGDDIAVAAAAGIPTANVHYDVSLADSGWDSLWTEDDPAAPEPLNSGAPPPPPPQQQQQQLALRTSSLYGTEGPLLDLPDGWEAAVAALGEIPTHGSPPPPSAAAAAAAAAEWPGGRWNDDDPRVDAAALAGGGGGCGGVGAAGRRKLGACLSGLLRRFARCYC